MKSTVPSDRADQICVGMLSMMARRWDSGPVSAATVRLSGNITPSRLVADSLILHDRHVGTKAELLVRCHREQRAALRAFLPSKASFRPAPVCHSVDTTHVNFDPSVRPSLRRSLNFSRTDDRWDLDRAVHILGASQERETS